MALIQLKNISKTYDLGAVQVPVLRGVSLQVEAGEFVALMGTSGSGKTTLMNILGCLDRPTAGEYWFNGLEVSALSGEELAALRNQLLGFVFQNFNLLPRTSALNNVALPLSYCGCNLTDQEVRERAAQVLSHLGLGDRLDYEPAQLSGGQQQRVAIARALVNRPLVLLADEPTGNLDSATTAEVLEILKKLHREEGLTIILVTHDEEVARAAQRLIRIHDGMIQDGVPPANAGPAAVPKANLPSPEKRPAVAWNLFTWRWMLRTALGSLRRNLLRAALTALGIIIGVAAVIAMMEIGHGSATAVQRTIANMGANNILILPGTAASSGVTFGTGTVVTLKPEDAAAIAAECPAVRAVAPIVRARTQVIYGNRNWVPISIYGTTPAYLEVRDWPVAAGEAFTEAEVRSASRVCLLGQTVARELFEGESPIGREVRIRNVPFKVIGVLARKGANMVGIDQDDILLAPWTAIKSYVAATTVQTTNQSAATTTGTTTSGTAATTMSRMYPGGQSVYPPRVSSLPADAPSPTKMRNIDQIVAAARSADELPQAMEQITKLLRERHRLRPDEPDDFSIRDMTEMTKTMASTANLMTRLLLAVALISLVVGGVGIMNIMLVSVTERTREIGLRMAVGAPRRNILIQFLVEAVVLCFCGGGVGILAGRGISYLVQVVLGWPTELAINAIISAFLVSVSVGIVFGYYPAWKASRLDPIVALRYE